MADQPPTVAVIGDLMVDRTRWIDACRSSGARECFAGRQFCVEDRPGGAAHVAGLLRLSGADVDLYGIVGADAEGAGLLQGLHACGVQPLVPSDESRPTTLKERFVAGSLERPEFLGRIDHESVRPLSRDLESCLLRHFADCSDGYRGLLISDYAKGVCSESLMSAIIADAKARRMVIVVDPARRESCQRFAGCDVITPNRDEAGALSGMAIDTLDDAERAGLRICEKTGAGACVVTLDTDGALWVTSAGTVEHVPALGGPVVDTTGAGDAFAASLLLQLVCGQGMPDAVRAANLDAGRQVRRFGTALPGENRCGVWTSRREPRSAAGKLRTIDEFAEIAAELQKRCQSVVFTNGCFDLLHPGHVHYLEQASAEGDCLVVALNAESTVRDLKGQGRPILSTAERSQMLAALECVDFVLVFDEPTPHQILRRLRPDVLVKGGDYALEDVAGREIVESYGGRVRTLGLTPGLSTTDLVRRIGQQRSVLPGAG